MVGWGCFRVSGGVLGFVVPMALVFLSACTTESSDEISSGLSSSRTGGLSAEVSSSQVLSSRENSSSSVASISSVGLSSSGPRTQTEVSYLGDSLGTFKFALTDSSRKNPLYPSPEYREMLVQVWFPLQAGTQSMRSGKHPVILISPGYQSSPYAYNSLFRRLAMQGYVTMTVWHPYQTETVTYPDGHQVKWISQDRAKDWPLAEGWSFNAWIAKGKSMEGKPLTDSLLQEIYAYYRMSLNDSLFIDHWSRDQRFALTGLAELARDPKSPLFERVDADRALFSGGSYGGTAAAWSLMQDSRVKAAADFDGTSYFVTKPTDLGKPYLYFKALKAQDAHLHADVLFAQTSSRFWELSFDCQHSQLGDSGPLGIPEVMYRTILALADEYVKQKGTGLVDAEVAKPGSFTLRSK
jgi:hypothetical protein